MLPVFPYRLARFLAVAGLALTGLAACVDMPDEPPPTPPYPYVQMAPMAPPLPLVETKPEINDPRHDVWRPGYFAFNGIGFDWVPGEVVARPSPTAVWSPDRWELRDYGWVFIHGYWQ